MHAAQSSVEGLVDLRHLPADRRLLLDDIDLVARLGDVERGLDSGDTAADHKRALGYGAFARGERRIEVNLCYCGTTEDDRLFGRTLLILVYP